MRITIKAGVLAAAVTVALLGGGAPAWAGTPGVNPSGCGTGSTPKYTDFTIGGVTMREEIRYAAGCGRVGWGRLSRIAGTAGLNVTQSAWNPNGASQYGVPGTNWTYTVNANPGTEVCAGFHASSVDGLGRETYLGWFFAGCWRAP